MVRMPPPVQQYKVGQRHCFQTGLAAAHAVPNRQPLPHSLAEPVQGASRRPPLDLPISGHWCGFTMISGHLTEHDKILGLDASQLEGGSQGMVYLRHDQAFAFFSQAVHHPLVEEAPWWSF